MGALPGHDFTVYASERAEDAPAGAGAGAGAGAVAGAGAGAGADATAARSPYAAPAVTVLPLHGPPPAASRATRRGRAEAAARFRDLAATLALPTEAEDSASRFAAALHDLAVLARDGEASLPALLASQAALCALEDACRAPGARPPAAAARVVDLIGAARLLERALRPLHAPWYGPGALADADLCHAVTGGTALLPGLLAKRFFGTPLLVTEHGSRLRETLLALRAAGHSAPVRALLGAFHRLLAAEAYGRADALTAGAGHVRRWQRRCGADPARIRTVHPGYPDASAAALARAADAADLAAAPRPPLLTWVGRVEPAKDLLCLLHAHAALRRTHPGARLRLAHPPVPPGTDPARYLTHCHEVAAGLFPAPPPAADPGTRPPSGTTAGERAPAPCGPVPGPAAAPTAAPPEGPGGRTSAASDLAGEAPSVPVPGSAPAPSGAAGAAPEGARADVPPAAAGRGAGAAPGPYPLAHDTSAVGFVELGSADAPDLAAAYAAADLVVLSSAVEGFPITVVEAMLAGRAVVATDVGAVREVLGDAGVVVSPRNPAALAAACAELLEDAARRRALAAAGQERARELFTAERNVRAFRGLYLDLLAHAPLRPAERLLAGVPA
jgi:glycosyltransferase involved in cell wall biosynthesis